MKTNKKGIKYKKVVPKVPIKVTKKEDRWEYRQENKK